MALIWNDKYCTQIDSIDRQHKRLFSNVNKLKEALDLGYVEGPKVENILDFLENYTKMHFKHEEFCMEERKCKAAEKNKPPSKAMMKKKLYCNDHEQTNGLIFSDIREDSQ